jgi:hypothetical protein
LAHIRRRIELEQNSAPRVIDQKVDAVHFKARWGGQKRSHVSLHGDEGVRDGSRHLSVYSRSEHISALCAAAAERRKLAERAHVDVIAPFR